MRANDPNPRRGELLLTLLDILRAHLIRSKFALTAFATEVSNTNADILYEFAGNPDANMPRLARTLALNKSSISRGIAQLRAAGYLRLSKRHGTVERRKIFEITAKGGKFLALQREYNYSLMAEMCANLEARKQERFVSYMEAFADGAGAPPLPSRGVDILARLDVALDRLTRAFGITSGDFLGSSYAPSDWVLLSEIHYAKRQAHELAGLLGVPANTVSQILKKYRGLKLVDMRCDPHDQRRNVIELAAGGRERVRAIENAALALFGRALANLDDSRLHEFVQLMGDYVGRSVCYRSIPLGANLTLARATREDDLQQLRRFLVKALAERGLREYPLGAALFAPAHVNLKLTCGDELAGAVELSSADESAFAVCNLLIAERRRRDVATGEFFSAIRKMLPGQAPFDGERARRFLVS